MGLAAVFVVVGLVVTAPLGGGVLLVGAAALGSSPCSSTVVVGQAAGSGLDAEQVANAATITQVSARSGLPARAAVIAVATALQESSLRNLNYGDAAGPDSRGLFQQRIRYYGAQVATDPARATAAFLTRLVLVPNWQFIPLTVAAAEVQRPRADLEGAYARWEQTATDLVAPQWRGPMTSGPTDIPAESPVLGCPTDGEGGAPSPGGGGLPAGYVLPSATQGAVAVRQALAQLGKPYVWGGVGPGGFDCSGLSMTAWAAAGVAIPRTAAVQAGTGVAVTSTAAMQPGDLIFIAGSHGTPASPGHLGMYIGISGGVQYLVHAPQSGTTVHVRPVSRWDGLIVAIRRPVVAVH